MNLRHYEQSRSILLLKHFEVQTSVDIERKVLLFVLTFGLLKQEKVKILHDCLLRQVFGVLNYNLINLLGFLKVL
jgi:hypothetical protein